MSEVRKRKTEESRIEPRKDKQVCIWNNYLLYRYFIYLVLIAHNLLIGDHT